MFEFYKNNNSVIYSSKLNESFETENLNKKLKTKYSNFKENNLSNLTKILIKKISLLQKNQQKANIKLTSLISIITSIILHKNNYQISHYDFLIKPNKKLKSIDNNNEYHHIINNYKSLKKSYNNNSFNTETKKPRTSHDNFDQNDEFDLSNIFRLKNNNNKKSVNKNSNNKNCLSLNNSTTNAISNKIIPVPKNNINENLKLPYMSSNTSSNINNNIINNINNNQNNNIYEYNHIKKDTKYSTESNLSSSNYYSKIKNNRTNLIKNFKGPVKITLNNEAKVNNTKKILIDGSKKMNEHILTDDKNTLDELNKDLERNNTFSEGFKYKRKFSESKEESNNKKLSCFNMSEIRDGEKENYSRKIRGFNFRNNIRYEKKSDSEIHSNGKNIL